jgi:hypothetical protein
MSEQRFEPEVLALLDEIARSPDATLLRIPRERLLRYVGRPEEMISPHGSWLTKAEKHLVTAYREQAARVLLEVCILRLKEDPLIFSTTQPDPATLATRARKVARRLPKQSVSLGTLNDLAGGRIVPTSILAVASLRLAPSDLATNALGLAHQQEGHVMASMRVLKKSLASTSSFHQRAQAWENLGRAYSLKGLFRNAFECDYRAILTDDRKLRFVVWCLADAIQGGDEPSALESAKRIHLRQDSRDAITIARDLLAGRANGSWSPTPAGRRLASRIRKQLPEESGAICDAFS